MWSIRDENLTNQRKLHPGIYRSDSWGACLKIQNSSNCTRYHRFHQIIFLFFRNRFQYINFVSEISHFFIFCITSSLKRLSYYIIIQKCWRWFFFVSKIRKNMDQVRNSIPLYGASMRTVLCTFWITNQLMISHTSSLIKWQYIYIVELQVECMV